MKGSRRYEQPYSSRHVLNDTTDSIRAQEPAYIKNFPRFLHLLYRKQTPFNSIIMATIQQATTSRTKKSSSNRSPAHTRAASPIKEASNTASLRKSLQQKSPKKSESNQQTQHVGFQTLGQRAKKSPTQMSSVPSDFEHIFHYSETQ